MNRTLLDFWVGLFVAMGIAASAFLALRVANQSTFGNGDTYTVTAYFQNIGGLKVRAPVKSAGVTVGRVTDISLDEKTYQAKVTLALEEHYRFSSDSSAGIFTSGLLGDQYVSLDTGGDTEFLRQGDSVIFTSSALVLENLVGKFIANMSSSGNK